MSRMGPPDWVAEPLSWVGLKWPDGDPVGLTTMSDGWLQYSRDLWGQLWAGDGAAGTVQHTNSGAAIDAFGDWWKRFGGPQENLQKSITSARRT